MNVGFLIAVATAIAAALWYATRSSMELSLAKTRRSSSNVIYHRIERVRHSSNLTLGRAAAIV